MRSIFSQHPLNRMDSQLWFGFVYWSTGNWRFGSITQQDTWLFQYDCEWNAAKTKGYQINCDNALHLARDCSEPKDAVEIKKNQNAHTAAKLANRRPMDPEWRLNLAKMANASSMVIIKLATPSLTNGIKMLLHHLASLLLLMLPLLCNPLGNLPLLLLLQLLSLLIPMLEAPF